MSNIVKSESKSTVKSMEEIDESALEKESRKAFENFKLNQNHELLALLESEQENEKNREERMKKVSTQVQRKDLEKEFAEERSDAQRKIQKLYEQHEINLKEFIKGLEYK